MTGYRRVNYTDVEPVSGGMHFLGEPLDSEQIGVTFVKCDPNWNSKPHDHADDGHEEVYVLVEGEATAVVDDEQIPMERGDVLWIDPESTRQIRNGESESVFILVSGPMPLGPDEDDTEWLTDGMIG